jgi:hypothetical protein
VDVEFDVVISVEVEFEDSSIAIVSVAFTDVDVPLVDGSCANARGLMINPVTSTENNKNIPKVLFINKPKIKYNLRLLINTGQYQMLKIIFLMYCIAFARE